MTLKLGDVSLNTNAENLKVMPETGSSAPIDLAAMQEFSKEESSIEPLEI